MRFWDASAIVPLLVREPRTDSVLALQHQDAEILVWWATPIECASAICRRERSGELEAQTLSAAFERLEQLAHFWHVIQARPPVGETALRLLRVHPLRSADAQQLASAIVAAEGHPRDVDFVCLDTRLAEAAEREGFKCLPRPQPQPQPQP